MNKINNIWNLWFHSDYNVWTINGYKLIYTIKLYDDLELYFNNIDYIGGLTIVPFYIMKEGIYPIWEDENNINGGEWSFKIDNKKELYNIWKKLVYYIIFNDCILINGISVIEKNNLYYIKIWINNE